MTSRDGYQLKKWNFGLASSNARALSRICIAAIPIFTPYSSNASQAFTLNSASTSEQSSSPHITSIREYLLFVSHALQNGLFLPESFYADSNIKASFAVSTVKWLVTEREQQSALISDLSYISRRPSTNVHALVGRARIDSTGKVGFNGTVDAGIGISCTCTFRLSEIDAVFGRFPKVIADQHRIRADIRPVPDTWDDAYSALARATDPMGNKIVTYTVTTAGAYTSQLIVELGPDGYVTSIRASQKEQ